MVTRSLQVQMWDPTNAKNYTDLQVLQSNAGFYVGTLHNDPRYGPEPGSRDTDYFPSKEIAEQVLKILNDCTESGVIDGIFDCQLADSGLDPRYVGYRFTP